MPTPRADARDDAEPFDLLIVGGGVNGAGIARDAAGRGFKVALFERDDLAGHTSSKSTKLIHGGLRYLENYEFRLVREALQERSVLLGIAPHIMRPLRFVMPHSPHVRPAWMIRAGLLLYDTLGGRTGLPGSHGLRLRTSPLGAPLKARFQRGFVYSDAQTDDSRLVALNALDAAERGALIETRAAVLSAWREAALWRVTVQAQGEAVPREVRARTLVNAGGPWVEAVRDLAGERPDGNSVRLVKGGHIVVPRLFEGEQAYILQNPDRRIVFAIPYEDRFTLIGTTDVVYEGDPSQVEISAQETAYLCDSINAYFERQIGPQDVVWSYAGVRPLYDDHAANASKVTRDYVLDVDEGGPGEAPMLSVYGGKITTYRRLAEHALDRLQARLGAGAGVKASWTGGQPLPGGDVERTAFAAALRQRFGWMDDALASRLARSYGSRALQFLQDAASLADLGEYFGAGLTAAEVRYLIDREWARTAEDVLWRRSKLGLHLTPAQVGALERWFENGRGQ